MKITFDLTKQMVEDELISIFKNRDNDGYLIESPLLSQFTKRLYKQHEYREYWQTNIRKTCGVSEYYEFYLIETPFGIYAFVKWIDNKREYKGGVFQLTNARGKHFKYIKDSRNIWV